MLTLLFCASLLPPAPWDYKPKTIPLSPKYQDQIQSLGSPMVIVPRVVFQGFTITNLTIGNGQAVLRWQLGRPCFQVEGEPSLAGPWSTVGNTTVSSVQTVPVNQNRFWRVLDNIAMPINASATNSSVTLNWQPPDIMGDSFSNWIIQRRQTDPVAGNGLAPDDDTGWTTLTPPGTPVPANGPFTYSDSNITIPSGGYLYRWKEQTGAGRYVPCQGVRVSITPVGPGSVAWSKPLSQAPGGTGVPIQTVKAVLDASGNIYTTGSFDQVLDFGNGSGPFLTTPNGVTRFYICKYSSSGVIASGFPIKYGTDNGIMSVRSIAVSADGNSIYVCGAWTQTGNWGSGPDVVAPNAASLWVAKYNGSGVLQWKRWFAGQFSGSSNAMSSIDLDENENPVCLGFYQFGLFDENGTFVGGDGSTQNGCLFKLSKTDGSTIWFRDFLANGGIINTDKIKVDRVSGKIYALMYSGAACPMGNPDPNAPENTKACGALGVYDTTKAWLWSHPIGLSYPPNELHGVSRPFDIIFDTSGNYYVVGHWAGGQIDFGGGPVTPAASLNNGFMVSYDSGHAYRWANKIAGGYNDVATACLIYNNQLVVTGGLQNGTYLPATATFYSQPGGTEPSITLNPQQTSGYIARYTLSGQFQDVFQYFPEAQFSLSRGELLLGSNYLLFGDFLVNGVKSCLMAVRP